MDVNELIEMTKAHGESGREYWFKVENKINEFLKGDHPEEEKSLLRRKGCLEMVYMLCRGYEYEDEQNKNK